MIFATRFQLARVCCPEVSKEKGRKGIMVPPPFELPLSLPLPSLLSFPSPLSLSISIPRYAARLFVPVVFSIFAHSRIFYLERAGISRCGYLHDKRRALANCSAKSFVACTHDLGWEVRSLQGRARGYRDLENDASRSSAWSDNYYFPVGLAPLYASVWRILYVSHSVSPSNS